MKKFLFSFLAMAVGWIIGFVYYLAWSISFNPHGRITDFDVIFFLSAIYIFIGWALFVVPLVIFVSPTSWIFRLPGSALFWPVYGLLAFVLTVGLWSGLWSEPLFILYAMIVGFAAGMTYEQLLDIFNIPEKESED